MTTELAAPKFEKPWHKPYNPPTPKLRSASNSFKHGLYAKKLAYTTPGDQEAYASILHNYVEHYHPITPDEMTLVQQLAALQFRHLKVQEFYAESMRLEVLAQCKNAAPDPQGNPPTELTIETRAFNNLAATPHFQLYLRELNRLPHKIQRVIDRIYLVIRLRSEVAAWPCNIPKSEGIAETESPAPAQPALLPIEVGPTPRKRLPGEEEENFEETKRWPDPIASKEKLVDVWNHHISDFSRNLLLYGPYDYYGRDAFFRMSRLKEGQFWEWIKQAEAEGSVILPPKREKPPQAA
jgi:hypothetical protein